MYICYITLSHLSEIVEHILITNYIVNHSHFKYISIHLLLLLLFTYFTIIIIFNLESPIVIFLHYI